MARELQSELGPMAEWTKTGSRPSVDAVMNWCTRLEGTPSITLPQAMALKQTIQDLSFESILSAKLLAAVESKVMATATAAIPTETASPASRRKEESKLQTLLKPENFITVSEWSVLQEGPAPARLETLLRRYLLPGITNLTEKTVHRGLAFLLATAAQELTQMPTYEEIYEEVQVFKRSWESLKQEAGPSQVGLLTYPKDPSSLPKALFDRAYTAEDPPMGKDVRSGIWLARDVAGPSDSSSSGPIIRSRARSMSHVVRSSSLQPAPTFASYVPGPSQSRNPSSSSVTHQELHLHQHAHGQQVVQVGIDPMVHADMQSQAASAVSNAKG